MSNPSSDSFRNVTRYQGQDYSFAPRYIRGRDPHSPTNASNDIKPKEQQGYYPTGSFWTNSTNGNLWALQKITANLANWILLSSGTSGPMLMVTVPNGTSPIVPDTTGTMNFTSSAGTVVITGSSASPNNHTINFDVMGGLAPIEQFTVDAHTGPGTNPVLPSGTGNITITGAQVAQGVVGTNVIRTDSLAANTYTVEIQRSTAVASTTLADNGVSHFDSAAFQVDANAFVQLKGGGQALSGVVVDAHTAPGTSPVVPNASGQITVTGNQVAAMTVGTDVIRTNSLAANTYTIEIQRATTAASADPTKNGVSHYKNTEFTVDTNGFVSLASGLFSVIVQTFNANGTYTPTSGMKYCTIECVGGGGGGGAVQASAAGTTGGGGGGSGGGYVRKTVSAATIGGSQAVTIGAGGAGGAAGANNGGTGGASSVGAIVSATAGVGGQFGGNVTATLSFVVVGGVGSGGDINAYGGNGGQSIGFTTVPVWSGGGGSSYFGAGAVPVGTSSINTTIAGVNATTPGSGGSGAVNTGTSGASAGGNGAAGFVVITEYVIA
jgi:hypothetical protein